MATTGSSFSSAWPTTIRTKPPPLTAGSKLCKNAGHPVARLEMPDIYSLGAEFYRWEYATAIAGHILGIHPFDQPDVQGAKDRTVSVLDRYQGEGQLPLMLADEPSTLRDLLDAVSPRRLPRRDGVSARISRY